MNINKIVLLITLMAATQAWAVEPVARIISQSGAPLNITSYTAAHQDSGRYTREGIRHTVEYVNVSDKNIVALQMSLVSFDIWNEFMVRTGGIAIEDIPPGGTEKGEWVASAYADFSFLTGFAYVSKVRFSDGVIWEADLEAVAKEMQKIEKGFDVEKLKGKPEQK